MGRSTQHERDRAGLYVARKLAIDTSEVAREAWRSMKNGALSLSFGFMTNRSHKRSDGVKELLDVDMFEISVVPHPANMDTRILSMKAGSRRREAPSLGELRKFERELGLEDPQMEAYRDMLALLRAQSFEDMGG